jgi:hypothetical protein
MSLCAVYPHSLTNNTDGCLLCPPRTTQGKDCPACGMFIEKNQGCDIVMCGSHAHGDVQRILRLGVGCGHEFRWSTLEPYRNGKPGAPANERQVKFATGYHEDAAAVKGLFVGRAGLHATPVASLNLLPIGSMVALHNVAAKRFLRISEDGAVSGSEMCVYNGRPGTWTDTVFMVVDAGANRIALHSPIHNCFVRVANGGHVDAKGGKRDVDALPWGWQNERLTAVDAGAGLVAFHNAHHQRFIRMQASNHANVHAHGVNQQDPWPAPADANFHFRPLVLG